MFERVADIFTIAEDDALRDGDRLFQRMVLYSTMIVFILEVECTVTEY